MHLLSMPLRDQQRSEAHPPADLASLLLFGGAGLAAFFAGYELIERFFLAPRFGVETLYLLHIIRGITASLLLASFAAWYVVNNPTLVRPAGGGAIGQDEWRVEHLQWFIHMRWIAAGFTIALIVIAVPLTGILSPAHLPQLVLCWGVLVASNVLFTRAVRQGANFEQQVVAQSAVDLVVLSGMLNASGGIENPLSIAYLFHVIIAGILLPKRKAVGVALFACGIFSLLALGELLHILPHASILLFPRSQSISGGHLQVTHAAHDVAFVAGRVVSFVAVMLLTSHFTTLITERLRQSEAALEKTARKATFERRRLEDVIDAAGLGLAIIGPNEVEWVNERLASWLGWHTTPSGSWPHDSCEAGGCFACAAAETFARGEQTEMEIVRGAKQGRARYFRDVTSPVRDAEGKVLQVVEVVEDITVRKAIEAEALHAGRLSVLGQLAAGIAHEIGNPLSSLQARLQLMKRRPDPEFQRESLDVLQSQIDRIGRIVRSVAHLSHNGREGRVSVDVNAVMSDALSLVKLHGHSKNVRFVEQPHSERPIVRAVRDQLLQVMLNLMLNAVDAMPEGGTLDVTTSIEQHRVRVAIRDTGTGIDPAIRRRLFEPFFTTKAEGTGLGLSICYSLVDAHGGTILVDSEPGFGSCFTVDLPLAPAAPSAGRAQA